MTDDWESFLILFGWSVIFIGSVLMWGWAVGCVTIGAVILSWMALKAFLTTLIMRRR